MEFTKKIIVQRISKSTLVVINRRHVNGYDPRDPSGYTHGPLTISEADAKGLFSSDSGTMSVDVKVAGDQGHELEGYQVHKRNSNYFYCLDR